MTLGQLKNATTKRLHRLVLSWATRSQLARMFYYFFLDKRFDREMRSVVLGKHEFASKGQEGSISLLRRNIHRLEKGLIMHPRRPVFALEYIEETQQAYSKAILAANSTVEPNGSVLTWAHDVLESYYAACGKHPLVAPLLKKFTTIPPPQPNSTHERSFRFIPYNAGSRIESDISLEEFHNLARRRRSVRWFQERPVPRILVEKAVEIAGLAPSACNRQPFEFRFYDDPTRLREVAALPGGVAGFDQQFPLIGVLVGNLAYYYDERDRHAMYIDGGLATMSLLFALEILGLGSCCINWPDIEETECKADKTLGLRGWERPILFLAIGYADPEGGVPYSAKKTVSELCRWNYVG